MSGVGSETLADPLFQVGDKVVARRERRLHMTVEDVDPRTDKDDVLYCCTVDDEHSAAHGRGRSIRWFVEQDLEPGPGYARETTNVS